MEQAPNPGYTLSVNDPENLASSKLVQIHQTGEEWQGNLIVDFLRDHGLEATLRPPPGIPPLDAAERFIGNKKVCGILVLERESDRARSLVTEFLSTAVTNTQASFPNSDFAESCRQS